MLIQKINDTECLYYNLICIGSHVLIFIMRAKILRPGASMKSPILLRTLSGEGWDGWGV